MMLTVLAIGWMLVAKTTVDAREVTIGDLVRDAEGRRPTRSWASHVALRLPAGRRRVTLTGRAAIAMLRRYAVVVVPNVGSVTVAIRAPKPTERICWTAIRGLAGGEVITDRDVERAPCTQTTATITMQSGTPVLRDAVGAGAMLGRLTPASIKGVAAGRTMTLRSVAGPVTIERAVKTLQPGRSGRSIFVRDGQGQVFAVPLLLMEKVR